MKKSYYISLILLFVFFLFFSCQRKKEINDSFVSSEDSLYVYLSLANEFDMPIEKKQEYNQKAFAIIVNQENDSVNKVNLFKVANRYYNINDWKGFFKTVKVVLENSKISKDTVNIAKAYSYIGDYYGARSISDSAFLSYFKAEKMYMQLNDNYNLARTRLNKANLQYAESDLLGSEKAVFNALRVLKDEKPSDLLYELYNLLGILYNDLEEYDKAIEFHNKALENIDDKLVPLEYQSKATSLNNFGYVYLNLHDYKEAKKYFQQGLEQNNLIRDKPALYAMLLDNLAYSRFKLNESKELPALFYQSLKMRDSLGLTTGVILNKIHLSEYFAARGDTLKAIQYSKQALEASRRTNNYRNVLAPLKQMAIVESKKASTYSKEYIVINDSLQKAERKMGDKFSRIEYETDEIKDENTDLVVQNRNIVYFFGILTMGGLFLFVIKTQKAKHRELMFKQQQQKANEDIYNLMISQQNTIETSRITEKKRVARELHDSVLGRMFGVRINLDSLNKINDEEGEQKRNNYLVELKNIEQDIRQISHDLNREKSELINNFVAIVENLFEEQKKTFSAKLVSNIDTEIAWESISNAVKINLYRIIQESLQNINKYANANTIKIELKKEFDNLFLEISDDGIGFNVKNAKKGIGLQNINYRTDECYGKLDIKSKKGEGTIVTVTVPIEQIPLYK